MAYYDVCNITRAVELTRLWIVILKINAIANFNAVTNKNSLQQLEFLFMTTGSSVCLNIFKRHWRPAAVEH